MLLVLLLPLLLTSPVNMERNEKGMHLSNTVCLASTFTVLLFLLVIFPLASYKLFLTSWSVKNAEGILFVVKPAIRLGDSTGWSGRLGVRDLICAKVLPRELRLAAWIWKSENKK